MELLNKIPPAVPKLLCAGFGAAFALCLAVAMWITEPAAQICWFAASGIFAVLSVCSLEEVLSLSGMWRISVALLVGVIIVLLFWYANSYVMKKDEVNKWAEMVQAAKESAQLAASRQGVLEPSGSTQGEPTVTNGKLLAGCHLGASSCELRCSVQNTGSPAVRDVAIGFVGVLPSQTRLAAPPDGRFNLEKSETLPVPDPEGKIDRTIRAFTVRIPLVPPKTTFPFTLWTDDDNNRKACEQRRVINEIRRAIFGDLFQAVRKVNALEEENIPKLETLFSAIGKRENLFQPDLVLSDLGRNPVVFLSRGESASLQFLQQHYPSLKKRFKDIWQDRGECMVPVFTAEQSPGVTVTFASYPPDVKTYATFRLSNTTPKEGVLRPAPPSLYTCTKGRR